MEIEWPVFSKKELVIGDLSSKIGVSTLWSPREWFAEKYIGSKMNKVAVVGNLYSVFGIGILIRNFLANPKLRYLIVSGTEFGKAKEVLETLQILGSDSDLSKKLFLEEEHVSRFLAQTKIIFVEPKEVKSFIEKESLDPEFELCHFEPLIVPLPKPSTDIFPASDSSHLIRARTIAEGYTLLLKEIRTFGHITNKDSEGHFRQELWRLEMNITEQDPLAFDSVPHPEYDAAKIQKYCEDFWNGTEPKDLAYRYGHIIRVKWGDQVEAAIAAFKEKRETFRTVISLWDPDIQSGSVIAEDPPCIITMHPKLISKRLVLGGYIRTNDMYGGWPLNVMAFRYFQHRFLDRLKKVLGESDLELGSLAVQSGSAHIYERDWIGVANTIKESPQYKFYSDPKGNFEIKVENDQIIVRHFSPGGELLQELKGAKALELSKKLAPFISQIQNALYVGRELMKAELELYERRLKD